MIDFSNKTYRNILNEQLAKVPDTVDKREGSMIQTALGPESWYLEGVYLDLDRVQKNAHAETAGGEALELICAERGIRRKRAGKAVKRGTFNVPVPIGSRFSTIGEPALSYRVIEKLTEEPGACVYYLECETPGTSGNSYTGALLAADYVTGLTLAGLDGLAEAGTEEESDESLRARYMETFDTPSFGGNAAAYRGAVLGMDGVGAVQIYPAWQGGGTVLCSILGSDMRPAPESVVKRVQQAICPLQNGGAEPSPAGYGFAPIGAAVTVVSADALEVDIACSVQFEAQASAETLRGQIRPKLEEYLKEVNAEWGRQRRDQTQKHTVVVYRARIIQCVMSVDGVVNVTDVKLNGAGEDLYCTQTEKLQQVPVLGEVMINGG